MNKSAIRSSVLPIIARSSNPLCFFFVCLVRVSITLCYRPAARRRLAARGKRRCARSGAICRGRLDDSWPLRAEAALRRGSIRAPVRVSKLSRDVAPDVHPPPPFRAARTPGGGAPFFRPQGARGRNSKGYRGYRESGNQPGRSRGASSARGNGAALFFFPSDVTCVA